MKRFLCHIKHSAKLTTREHCAGKMLLLCTHVSAVRGRACKQTPVMIVPTIPQQSWYFRSPEAAAEPQCGSGSCLVPYSFSCGTFLIESYFLLLSCLSHTPKSSFSNWGSWFLSLRRSYLKETSVPGKLQLGQPRGFWKSSSLRHAS